MRIRRLAGPMALVGCVLAALAARPTADVEQVRATPAADRTPGDYPLGPDSLAAPGVPRGRLEGPFLFRSRYLANTVRQYWIYVPAQYTPAVAANVLVFQDGQRAVNPQGVMRVPQVLENLIHKKDIPVTIGIFITPGQRGDVYPDTLGTGNPNNRAVEYDAIGDAYARFLVEEMLPEVAAKYTLATDPAGRAIGGASSGAICAFTVAWHRPDAFRNDLDNNHGNWFLANQQMLAAFLYANSAADAQKAAGPRYVVKHEWGDGAHADAHGGAILPDILRWIWSGPPN